MADEPDVPDVFTPPVTVRMKHRTDLTISISAAVGPPDQTGGVMIPYELIEQAEGHGFYICHTDEGDQPPLPAAKPAPTTEGKPEEASKGVEDDKPSEDAEKPETTEAKGADEQPEAEAKPAAPAAPAPAPATERRRPNR